MASARETALAALFARLQTVAGPTVARNAALPLDVPAGGLVVLRDGDPGEPDVSLNPRTSYYTHRAEVEIITADPAAGTAEAALDDVVSGVIAALASDRSLGGSVEYLSWREPEVTSFAGEGTIQHLGALVHVLIEYQTTEG